ncbi:CBS domain-containing protein [Desulfuromusa kysingii]|nr:CBS domain-containing protein [Desulfuromusa kysingii]
MRTKLVLAKPDCDYKRLLCKIADSVPRLAYVVDDNYKLLGIVSAVDLLKVILPSYMSVGLARSFSDGTEFLQKQVERVKDKRAEDIMVKKFSFLHPHHQLLKADAMIAEKGFNTLPVIDEKGKLLGEITRLDILVNLVNNCSDYNVDDAGLVDLSLL